MPEYTLDEMRAQARKAALYFERGLEGFSREFISVRSGETVVVVARGAAGVKLARFVEEGGVGLVRGGVENVAATPNGGTATPAGVALIALYHEPKEEFAKKGGNIHLHVLADVKLGRRVRKTG